MINTMKSRKLLWVVVVGMFLVVAACGGEQGEAADVAPADVPVAAPEVVDVATTDGGVVLVSNAELIERIATGNAPVILDVRTAAEFAEGHVPGAINISHDELAERIAEIESMRGDELVVYCRSGHRAGIAEALLMEQGFTNLKHLDGDMNGWNESGLRVDSQQ